jgi:hypothetical protein
MPALSYSERAGFIDTAVASVFNPPTALRDLE